MAKKRSDNMNHTICINASCDQPRAPFSVYCADCEAVEVSNLYTTNELPTVTLPPFESRSETVQVKLKPREKRALRTIARRKEQSLSDTVREMILLEIATWESYEPTLEEFSQRVGIATKPET